jgi:hypothetical protein
MLKSILLTSGLILSLSTTAFAQTTAANHPTPMTKGHNQSCLTIATACEDAGYRLSQTMPGKNVWRDCLRPVVAGKTINGVTASATDIQACKEHQAMWQKKFGKMTPGMDKQ